MLITISLDVYKRQEQIMTMLIRKNETQFEKHEFGDFKFVPLLENKN